MSKSGFMDDPWKGMEQDPDAIRRLQLSAQLLNPAIYSRILDIGCHNEEFKNYLPEDVRYTGINEPEFDFNQRFFDKEYDCVVCLEVLEHLTHPEECMKSIQYNLKPKGIALISLPNESTIFHRIRGLCGVMDAECFNSCGKHLHLPSLNQARVFISKYFKIEKEVYYYSTNIAGCRQKWLKPVINIVPEFIWEWLANTFPSLFARGWIFRCVN